ncbi:hypothetical protein BST97_08320 [Nonlabens spongiae]|uniref:UPF0246 protein BST97_08320 n=1 Tax=Nonlabens spongiae TaxID=331648 RepID=A0A1W6MK93_9FLAO|nr:peroxide stress protein YaaA [Nonlabens spongiae]ARN78003.1 hypothetical protein BST97_08320 [Nonlabens spongiae]
MKILLSPAKSLDYSSALPTPKSTQPQFKDGIKEIHGVMKKMSQKELAELMGISENLAALNYARFSDFSMDFTDNNSRPALFAFDGDVYSGLDAYTMTDEQIKTAQQQIRILSGLYGMLKPLDLIQPYRLEMGTKVAIGQKKNLYAYWRDQLTETLNKELKKNELVVNLASKEYFKAIDKKKLKGELIEPVFKDFKNGKLKVIAFYAKKARGSMARYLVDNKAQNKKAILNFAEDGYAFSEKYTEKSNQPVFVR